MWQSLIVPDVGWRSATHCMVVTTLRSLIAVRDLASRACCTFASQAVKKLCCRCICRLETSPWDHLRMVTLQAERCVRANQTAWVCRFASQRRPWHRPVLLASQQVCNVATFHSPLLDTVLHLSATAFARSNVRLAFTNVYRLRVSRHASLSLPHSATFFCLMTPADSTAKTRSPAQPHASHTPAFATFWDGPVVVKGADSGQG